MQNVQKTAGCQSASSENEFFERAFAEKSRKGSSSEQLLDKFIKDTSLGLLVTGTGPWVTCYWASQETITIHYYRFIHFVILKAEHLYSLYLMFHMDLIN